MFSLLAASAFWEWFMHAVNVLAEPWWFLSLSTLIFVLMFALYKWWTKPVVFAVIFVLPT